MATDSSGSRRTTASVEDAVTGRGGHPTVEDDASTFLEQHGHELHPALDIQSHNTVPNNEGSTQTEPCVFKESTYVYTKEFIEMMEAYEDASQDPKIKALRVHGSASWDEVLSLARAVEEKYTSAGKEGARKYSRKIIDKSAIMLPFVRMLPNDTLFSAITGGLRLVFEAGAKISERREAVLKSLLRIPDIIIRAEECCANFGPDKILYAKAENLYIAALGALQGTIKWLSRKTAGKPMRAIVLGSLYSKSFKDKMDDLDDAVNALESHVDSLRDNRSRRTGEGIVRLEAQVDHLEQLHQASKNAIEKMKEVLADTNKTAKWMRQKDNDIQRLRNRIGELEQAAAAITQEELCELLDVLPNHPDFDLQYLIGRTDPDLPEADIALGVTLQDTFQHWKGEDTSAALFIEGGLPLSSRRVSSLCVVSTFLIGSLKDSKRATAIYFFCGHHDKPSDPIGGPPGMIRSLIIQILRLFAVNLDFITPRLRPLLEKLNLRALCDCFSKLVTQLPASTVLFCIVDGISFFEKTEWIDDTNKAIGDLRDLVYDSDTGAVFKLLVTSPTRSRCVADIFEPENRLSLLSDSRRQQATERDRAMARRRPPGRAPRFARPASQDASTQGTNQSMQVDEYDSFSDVDEL